MSVDPNGLDEISLTFREQYSFCEFDYTFSLDLSPVWFIFSSHHKGHRRLNEVQTQGKKIRKQIVLLSLIRR